MNILEFIVSLIGIFTIGVPLAIGMLYLIWYYFSFACKEDKKK